MTAAPAEPQASRWEDFLEIFYAPSRVFARRGPGDWVIPLVVLVALTTVIVFATKDLMAPIMEAEATRGMAGSQPMTQEQIEAGKAFMVKFGPIIAIVFTAIFPVIVGVVLWLVGKTVGAVQAIGSAIMVAAFSYFPRLLGSAVGALQASFMAEEDLTGIGAISVGPARFADASTSPGMLGLLNRLDLFILWETVLLAIGLKVTGKIPTEKAVIAGIVIWILGSLPLLFQLMRGG